MNDLDHKSGAGEALARCLEAFHGDDSGVAMTEYILVFTLVSFGSTVSLLMCTIYIKAYRDFLVWWLGHPAV